MTFGADSKKAIRMISEEGMTKQKCWQILIAYFNVLLPNTSSSV